MLIVGEGCKRPSPLCSEKQVAQDVENDVEIIVANGRSDESTPIF